MKRFDEENDKIQVNVKKSFNNQCESYCYPVTVKHV